MGEKWRSLSFGTRGRAREGAASRRDGIPGLRRSGFWTLRATGRPHGRSWSWGRAGEGEGALFTSRRAVWPTGSRGSPIGGGGEGEGGGGEGGGEGEGEGEGGGAAGGAAEASSTTYVRQLSAAHVPALLDLNTAWRELFMAPAADGEAGEAVLEP